MFADIIVDWSHPVAAAAGFVVGLLIMLVRNRSVKVDVTIRQRDEEED